MRSCSSFYCSATISKGVTWKAVLQKAWNLCPAANEVSLLWRKLGALWPDLGRAFSTALHMALLLACWVTLLKSLCHSGHLFPAACPANRTGLCLHYRWETAQRFSCTMGSSAGAKGRAQNSSSSACTAQSSRDLAFGRAGCHCRADGM